MTRPPFTAAFTLRMAAAGLGVLILTLGLFRAVSHLNDLSGMRNIAGDWMALAQALNRGVLYPPVVEDVSGSTYYAGTRYMPLLFCLIAVFERVLGNYLLATKLVSLLAFLGLAGTTFEVGRRLTGRWTDALALTGLVLAFNEGQMALLLPHADALAVALSVGGLLALRAEKPSMATVGGAAVLFALAFLCKFSAVAAPVAAVLYLLVRDCKASIALALGFGLLVVASAGILYVASQGRIVENFAAAGSGGTTFEFIKIGPGRFGGALLISSLTAFVPPIILPLALGAVFKNLWTGGLRIWDWYFLLSIPTTVVIFTSPGTDLNHLLEQEVAAVLVIAQLLRAPAATTAASPPAGGAVVTRTALLLPLLIGCFVVAKHPEKELLRELLSKNSQERQTAVKPAKDWFWQEQAATFPELAEQLPPEPHLLTEDATPVVLLGQRPVVMDPFIFKILVEQQRIDDTDLVQRIDRREFNGLVMMRRLENPALPVIVASTVGLLGSPTGQGPFLAASALMARRADNPEEILERFHFGPHVNDAMRRNYRFAAKVGQYYVYRPSPSIGAPPP